MAADNTIKVEYIASTASAVQAVGALSASMKEQRDAADAAGKGQKGLARDVAATRAEQLTAAEASRKAAEALQVHTLTVQAFGKSSREATEAEAKLTAATKEAQRTAAAAAGSLEKLAKSVTAAAAAEDGNLSPATKRAAAQVEKMGKDAQKAAADLDKAALASKKGSAGFDFMGLASGKLMAVLGPAALGGTLIGLAGWLGEAAASTLQYETAIGNLPFAIEGAQAATRGLMSDSALAVSASQALALGVVKTEAEFNMLASDAAKIALKLGTSTDQMLGDLTTALGRGSAMILDNAGITLKVSDANEAYAKSIGKTVEQLDEAEKKIAFQTAAMKAIRESADATTVAYDGNAAAILRYKIAAGDAWASIERGAVNGAGAVAASITNFRTELEQTAVTADLMNQAMMRSGNWSQGFKDLSTAAGASALQMLNLGDVAANFQGVLNSGALEQSVEAERQKAALMAEEATQAERIAKAYTKIAADNEAFLQAQAEASLVYGPAAPPKEEKKKKGKKKKTAFDIVQGTDFRHDESDLVGEMFAADIAAEQAAAERSHAIKQEALAFELEILDARGLAEEEDQTARESLQARRLAADEAFARKQIELAATDAQREKGATALATVEHQKRLIALRKQQAEEAKAYQAKALIVERVTGHVNGLGAAMVDAAWQAAEGQKGAGLMALGEYLKTVSKQMAIKALVETALGVSALAGVVTAGLAPGHFAAAGIAAGVAVAAGGAGAGLSAAGDARGAGGGGGRGEAGAANDPGTGSAGGGGGGGGQPKRELNAQEVPVSYYDPAKMSGSAGGAPININFAGATFIGSKGPEDAAQQIETILRKGKSAGMR